MLAWIVALLLLATGVATCLSARRIEQLLLASDGEHKETRNVLQSVTTVVQNRGDEHSKSITGLLENLDALKLEQVNVAARIPVAITSDIIPQLDRLETALEAAITAAKPSTEFNA